MREYLFIIAFLNFASYFWSVFGVFRSHSEKESIAYRALQINSILIWFCGLYLIFVNENFSNLHGFVLTIQVACLAAFWNTSTIARKNRFTIAFSKDVPVKLIQYGLYRYVRHPFYTIYSICYISLIFVSFDVVYSLLVFSMLIIYFLAAKKEEKKFLATDNLSHSYEIYKKRTGMFFPKIRIASK